jgi:adenylate cyclase
MSSTGSEHKAAAIMFLDVVGYSRLMEADEDLTHRQLAQVRSELLIPKIRTFNGYIIKEMGDGFLATFDNPIDAAECAIQLQQNLAHASVELPSDRQILCRIALNYSDLIVDDHDVFGSGVNIASRLQNFAEPGCIIMSETFMNLVREHIVLPIIDLGELHLKNLREPVRAYSLRIKSIARASAYHADETRPSIAVLPFRFQPDDPTNRYFSEGIVDDIVRALSGLKELFVISRVSMLNFNDSSLDAHATAKKVGGVRYLLTGNVQRQEDQLRVRAELIDVVTDTVLWAERFDCTVTKLFELQDSIAIQVVSIVAPHVRERELQRALRKHPESMDAYDLVLQGIDLLYRMDYHAFARARGLLQEAMVLDPSYAAAHAYAAQWHIHRVAQGWAPDPIADGQEAARLAATAIDLDKYDGLALALHGHARSFLLKDYEAGRSFLDRALIASPNCALAWTLSSCTSTYLGDTENGINKAKYGLRLSPLDPMIYFYLHNLGMAYYVNESYDEAVKCGQSAAAHKRSFRANLRVLSASLVALNRLPEARDAARLLLESQPDFRVSAYAGICPFQDFNTRQVFLERLRLAGLPD